ncbi:MAG: tetratricopeptide repeat protein [Myxococcota bacterium]|nr:tetratricopeptide repeat protein [Myxococcota bacterium]
MTAYRLILGGGLIVLLIPQAWSNLTNLRTQRALDTQVAKLVTVGDEAQTNDRLREAVVAYQRAIELQPENSELLKKLAVAQCRFTAERPDTLTTASAIALLVRLKSLGLSAKDGPEIAVALGQVDLMRGRGAAAHGLFEKLAKEYPKSAIAQYALGKSRIVRGMTKQALEPFERAVALKSDSARFRKALGRTLSALKKWTRAEEALTRAVQISEDGSSLLELGQVRLKISKNEGAVEVLKKSLTQLDNRMKPVARAALGEALFQLGRYAEAIRELRASVKASGNTGTLFGLASAYQGLNKHSAAAQVLSRALADEPTNALGRVQYIRSLVALGQTERARGALSTLESQAKGRPELVPLVKKARGIVSTRRSPAPPAP